MTLSDYVLEPKSKFPSQPNSELPFAEFLINHLSNAACCIGSDARLLYANDAACAMTGYSREELLSMPLYDMDPGLSSRGWLEQWRSLKQQGRFTFEFQCQTKDSQIVPVEITLTYAKCNDRELACALIYQLPSQVSLLEDSTKLTEIDQQIDQELSDLRGREAALKQSLSLLNATLESTANGVVTVSFDGEILSVNQKFRDMWRIPDSVILSRKCARCKAFFESQFKDPEAFLRVVWEVSSHSDFESYDVFELKDGRIFAHYSKPQRLNGTIVGRVWSVWDVTESKQTERALRLSEARFRALAETTDTIIFIIQAGRLCYVNAATVSLTGYKRAELLDGFNLRQLIKSRSAHHDQDQVTCPKYQEMRILTKSGTEHWLACSVELLSGELDFAGKPIELVTAIDITSYKQAEAEVHQALEQAKQLSELRARFVSMVCHQLHTPLNVISYSTSLLRRHADQWTEEKKRLYFDYIQAGVEQISQLLNEMLLFGRAEAAKLKFEPKPFDLDLFSHELVAQMQIGSSQNSINFTSQGCSTACVDKKLLQPILTNLLSNAIKYSPSGSAVDLKLSYHDDQVVFQVQDAGIGIPVADQRQLFEPFHRGSNVGDISGNGLGLSIVKMLVDLHRGQIAVASEVGVGTTFTVILPLTSR